MSKPESNKVTRRGVLTASLGAAAGITALGTAQAAAPRRSRSPIAGMKVLVAVGEFSEGLETYYMVYRLMEEGALPVVAAGLIVRSGSAADPIGLPGLSAFSAAMLDEGTASRDAIGVARDLEELGVEISRR